MKKNEIGKTDIILYIVMVMTALLLFVLIVKDYGTLKSYTFRPETFPDPVNSTVFSIPKGNYSLDISYSTKNDMVVTLKADNDNVIDIPLSAAENFVSWPFTLEHPTDRAKLTFQTDDPSSFKAETISLKAEKFLCTDIFFHAALLLIFFLLSILFFIKKDKIDRKELVFLLLTCIVINLPLYIYSGSNWGVDTRCHMLRIEGIMTGLLDRQLPVIIAPNYLNEFGELSFLYPDFFLYPFGILRLLGVSMYTVYRFLTVFINVATVLSAYYSSRILCKNKLCVYAAVILYTFEAHRLRIMYMNGAGGGAGIAQIFIPLSIAGFYLIVKKNAEKAEKRKGVMLLAFGVSGVMESHIMSLLLLGVFLAVLTLSFIKDIRYVVFSGILALVMNAGFLVIFINWYFSGWSSSALFWSDYVSWCLTPKDILTSPQSHFYIAMLLLSVSLLVVFRKERTVEYKLALVMTVFTGMLYFMSTTFFPWKVLMDSSKLIYTLAMFIQQPHRFFSLIEAPAVLSPLLLISMGVSENTGLAGSESSDPNGLKLKKIVTVAIPVLSLVLVTGIFSEMKMFFANDPLLFDRIAGDYNTELLFDYVPEGTDEESIGPDAGKLSDESKVQSLSYFKRGTRIDYDYICEGQGVYADLPLLFYKGYRGWDETGKDVSLRKGDDGHILADLNGDGNNHSLHVRFKVNPVFTILWIISPVIAFVIFGVVFVKNGI